MMARLWSATVATRQAASFHRHLLSTGVTDYRRSAGCQRVIVLRHDGEAEVRFTLISLWATRQAMNSYGGATLQAVGYDGDDAFDLEPDEDVSVMTVVGDYPGLVG